MRHVRIGAVALACALAAPAVAYERDRATMDRTDVRQAQETLGRLGYPVGRPDGRLGPQTRTAIRNFQRDKNLNATGELNEDTMSALDAASSRAAEEPEEHAAPAPAHARASATDIRRAQERLDRLGYPVGRADGELGEETRTALRNFQRDHNLNATGELDPDTRAALADTAGTATSGAHHEEPR